MKFFLIVFIVLVGCIYIIKFWRVWVFIVLFIIVFVLVRDFFNLVNKVGVLFCIVFVVIFVEYDVLVLD